MGDGIAIIGMAGRFPGADSVAELWRNLCAGIESIAALTDEQLDASGIPRAVRQRDGYVKAAPLVRGIENFDARFFGFSAREAALLDPQHRIFLECAWEALEDAGHDTTRDGLRTGVFAGCSMSTYLLSNLAADVARDATSIFEAAIANDKDFLATRTSYKLDLRGPSMNVQTACSSSLVAVHAACQSLLTGECDLALAGGVTIRVPQEAGYAYVEGSILSPDGHCRPFDAGANGTLFGNGAGVVALRRLDDALADGDRVIAVIRGSAVNNDGGLKAGYTAPSVAGQAEVIAEALSVANIAPETIGYVEAHGTSTQLGDPIEMAALARAFGPRAFEPGAARCAIGSLKSNVGHLDAAAGVAGLIKTALMIGSGVLVPSLHFSEPHPAIDWEMFEVNTLLRPWRGLRRAGVSSFGIGGTNAHVVLEQAPELAAVDDEQTPQVLVVSAKSEDALEDATRRLAKALREDVPLARVAWTLQQGRRAFAHRRAFVASDVGEARAGLPSAPARVAAERAPNVVFLFPGQGAQYARMGFQLRESEPLFREHFDRCVDGLRAEGVDLERVPHDDMRETAVAQASLFAVEYSLARLFESWGVKPAAMIGHSIGEYVAACLAGVLLLDDALAVVAERGRLLAALPRGAMLAVPLGEDELLQRIADRPLSLAAVNGEASCVVAGPREEIDAFAAWLRAERIETQLLQTSHAFHSWMVEPAAEALAERMSCVALEAPRIPYVSNVTGDWAGDEVREASYWSRHLREPVRFGASVARVCADPAAVLLEIGPGRALTSLARRGAGRERVIAAALPNRTRDERVQTREALAQLWTAGVAVDWRALHGGHRPQRVALPTYPFQRERHWVERTPPLAVPLWTATARAPARAPQHWLVLGDVVGAVTDALRARGFDVETTFAPNHDPLPERVVHVGALEDVLRDLECVARRGGVARVDLITTGSVSIAGECNLHPHAAALLGIRGDFECRVIDSLAPLDALVDELLAAHDAPHVALRGRGRWIPRLERAPAASAPLFRRDARYAVFGSSLASRIAREAGATVIEESGQQVDGVVFAPEETSFAAMRAEEERFALAARIDAPLRVLIVPREASVVSAMLEAPAAEQWTIVRWDGADFHDLQRVDAAAGTTVIHSRPASAPRRTARAAFAAPRNELESRVAAIWEELLGTTPIGVDDDFFDLGGHSLIAAQIVARIRAEYPVPLPLDRLLTATTVARLAAVIESALVSALSTLSDTEVARMLEAQA